jgi:hypothetical protein
MPSHIVSQPEERPAGDIVTFSVVVAMRSVVQWNSTGRHTRSDGGRLLLTSVSVADEGQYSVVVTKVQV